MSYVVLARKYRPADFGAMVGQEHVVQALTNALTNQRLHHAYLFTGTRGVGKTTVSRILAKSLNCTGPEGRGGITANPCGVCQACREIDAGRYPDYVELDAASNRGVDEISQLLDQAVYKPVVGRFKVYMIDEVHMLSTHAFNAMLKTLEEPPDYLKFVLATTDPQKVPPTVLSRCLQFNLRPMAPQTVAAHLATVLAEERIEAEPAALRLLSRAARGSMRDALSLADQAIAYGAGALAEDGVREMLGAVDRGHVVRIVEAIAASDGAALVATVDGLRGLGLSPTGTLEELAALLQQMAVARAVPNALDVADPDTPEVARLAERLGADEIQLLYSLALHGRGELGLAPDEYGGLVMCLLRMLAFRPAGAEAAAPVVPGGGAAEGRRPLPSASTAGAKSAVAANASVVAAASLVIAESPTAVVAPLVVAAPPAGVSPLASTSPPRSVPARAEAVAAPAALRVPVTRAEPSPWEEPPPWLDDAPPVDESEARSMEALSSSSSSSLLDLPAEADAVDRREAADAPPAAAPADLDADETSDYPETGLGARWSALAQDLSAAGRIGAFARELAMQAECLALDDQATPVVCRLRVERETLRAAGPREKLRAALAEAFERPVELQVDAGPGRDTPARRDAAARSRRQAEAERVIREDPWVRSLMAQFKTARIVPGSVRPH